MSIKRFEEFVKSGIVRRRSPDVERAKSLIAESERKREFLYSVIKNVPEEKMNPNFIIEYCYDILLELIRAKILVDGYITVSHEAEVSYMRNLGFSEHEVRFMDEVRYHRNGIKYYGKNFDKEYAEKVFAFMEKIYPVLMQKIKSSI